MENVEQVAQEEVATEEQQAPVINLVFELTLDEANLILASLAKGQYAQVAGLIDKVRGQGEAQVAAMVEAAEKAEAEAGEAA